MPEHRQPRAVLDSKVFVSDLIGVKGPPRRIVDRWLVGELTLVTPLHLLEELAHVLSYPRIAERILLDQTDVDTILAALLFPGGGCP